MKLKGNIKVIEEIEDSIKSNQSCHRYEANILDDIKSGLCIRQYVVNTRPSLAMVKLILDYRVSTGEVHIKDDKIWKLADTMPDLIKPLCKLKPYYRHRWIPQDELARIWQEKQQDGGIPKKKRGARK